MHNHLFGKDIISISDLTKHDIGLILEATDRIKKSPKAEWLKGKIIANCFFEPSTRTRLSFAAAALKLGASVIGFSEPHSTSSGAKGESLHDSIKINACYADAIVIRHPKAGAARLAAHASDKPVLNAGDGINQHPTQTLLDLYSITECQGRMNKLHIAFVGDLKYGRTVHSLVQACALYDTRYYFVPVPGLELPDSYCDLLRQQSLKYSFHASIEDVIDRVDVIYMTRVQTERFNTSEQLSYRNPCLLEKHMLQNAKPNCKILHPLPRKNELDTRIDDTPFAYYFQQAQNGLYVRQALLALLLREELP